MRKPRGKAYSAEAKKIQAQRDDLQWLHKDFEQAKKELATIKENQIKGISLDEFIFNKFSTRLDPIYYIENILRAHLPQSRQKLHSNQVELIRAVCNPRIRKVAGIMARQCFAKDTKIIMHDSSYKNIQDIQIGDKVLTPNEKIATVTATTSGRAPLYKIIPTDGYNLPYIVTDNHRLHVSNHLSIKQNIMVKDYIRQYGYISHEWRGYRHTLINSEKPLTGFLKDYLSHADNKMKYLAQHLYHFIDIYSNVKDELEQILHNSLAMRMDFIYNLIKMPYTIYDNIHDKYIIDVPLYLKDLFMRIIWSAGYKCKWQDNKIHMHQISSTTYSFKIEPYKVDNYYGITIDSNDHLILLEDCTITHNSGKCFAPGTLIMMADGRTKKVEDIRVNDYVMSPESKPIRVKALGQGTEEMYEIRSKEKNHESFTVNGSHILSLIKKRKHKPDEKVNITVNEYLKLSKSMQNSLYGYRATVEFPECPLNIDPYFLGLWLGDGRHTYPEIATIDQEIINYLQEYANKLNMVLTTYKGAKGHINTYAITTSNQPFTGCQKENYLLTQLRQLNVYDNKHIPDIIMFNSINIRRQFLAGLIDSNISSVNQHDKGHTLKLSFTNKKVADDTLYLLRALGYKASMKQHNVYPKKGNKTYIAYRIFAYGDFSVIPTKLSRKQYPSDIKHNPLHFNFDVIPKGIGQYYGFTLDSDNKLFLLANCTVVHNTESISSFVGYLLDNYPNMRIGVFTPRIQQAEVTIGRLSIFYQMNEERLNNKIVKCTKQKIELSNNSYVSAVSASDQSNIEGLTFDIVVLDEAQKVSNYTYSERIVPCEKLILTLNKD